MKPAVLVLCLLAASFPALRGTEPSAPESNKKPSAHFRIRAFLMDEKQAISVALPQPNAEPLALLSASNGKNPINTPYEEFPPKEMKVDVAIGGKIHEVDVKLDAGIFYTLLLCREGGRLVTRLLQDTFPDPAEPGCHVRVCNFGSDRKAILSVGGNAMRQFDPNTFTELVLPPDGKVPINVSVLNPKGGYPANSNVVINTKSAQAVSVVIVPDYRGNFRPRVWMDGASR